MSCNSKPVVLVAEDDRDLIELVEKHLEREGFLVVSARNGMRAIRLTEALDPDVIVTDMMMPELDGFGLIARYLAKPDRSAPIVAMSSFREYLDHAIELGAKSALLKPFAFRELVRQVHASIEERPPVPLRPAMEDPAAEETRLRAILDLHLDERAPEPELNALIERVAEYFGVPIALLSAITEDRQFWSAACGLPPDLNEARSMPRNESFCTHAVVARAALIVQDASTNPLFQSNPLVTNRGIRFYAGIPLISRHGEALGTLCLLDFEPRRFTHFDLELLSIFGCCVLGALEWRERRELPQIPDSAFRYLQYIDKELDVFGKAAFQALAVAVGSRAAQTETKVACAIVALPARRLKEVVSALRARHLQGFVGRLGHARLGWLVPSLTAEEARAAALQAAGPHAFAEAAELGHYPGSVQGTLQQLEMKLGDAGLT